MTYYAKSRQKNGRQPTVQEHLRDVSEKAGEYGEEIGLGEEARIAGLLHDFGKYSNLFKGVLDGTESGIDHAVGGALFLYKPVIGKQRLLKGPLGLIPILEAIRGHHDGLIGWGQFQEDFYRAKTTEQWNMNASGKTWSIQNINQYKDAERAFGTDFPDFKRPKHLEEPPTYSGKYSDSIRSMLYTRLLFSCLVDADYSVSAHEADAEGENYFETSENTVFDPSEALKELYAYREDVKRTSTADPSVNAIRDAVFEACGNAGEGEEGLYTLTAPTGTGKTLALLHFALRHCMKTGKRRIILVLPFLTLAEQNTEVYRHIVPDLLVDHSQSNLPDSQRELAARWRTPLIITTSVKFFESLFSYKPTDCRKLHNIANSVVVFDEAQSLPADLTLSTLNAVNELSMRWHVTMLFSTATQPDFSAIPSLSWQPKEILPDHASFYQALKRTRVDWRIGSEEWVPLSSVAEEMAEEDNVCAIVNLRKHAVKLFICLKERITDKTGLFMLTTDLCPAHHRRVVERIRERQKKHLPCYVVATQCIEAGVDLDFDVLFRALAPLDSVIQAAGRCNRNGRIPDGGRVVVFIPDEETLYPGDWYGKGAETVRRRVCDSGAEKENLDIHSPDVIRAYYQDLFRGQKEKPDLVKMVNAGNYEGTDREYRLIENRGVHVLVPDPENISLFESISREMKAEGLTAGLMKEAAPITVTTFEKDLDAWCTPVRFRDRRDEDGKTDWVILENHSLYYEDTGLQFTLPSDTGDADFSPFF